MLSNILIRIKAIIAPPEVLNIKGYTKKKANTSFPIIYLAIGKAKSPPNIPVPKISPIAVKYLLSVLLYIIPAKKAPIILPGKANRLPVPNIFLIREIKKAIIVL